MMSVLFWLVASAQAADCPPQRVVTLDLRRWYREFLDEKEPGERRRIYDLLELDAPASVDSACPAPAIDTITLHAADLGGNSGKETIVKAVWRQCSDREDGGYQFSVVQLFEAIDSSTTCRVQQGAAAGALSWATEKGETSKTALTRVEPVHLISGVHQTLQVTHTSSVWQGEELIGARTHASWFDLQNHVLVYRGTVPVGYQDASACRVGNVTLVGGVPKTAIVSTMSCQTQAGALYRSYSTPVAVTRYFWDGRGYSEL